MPPQLGPGAFGFGHPLTMVAVQVAMIQPMSIYPLDRNCFWGYPGQVHSACWVLLQECSASTTNVQIQQQSNSWSEVRPCRGCIVCFTTWFLCILILVLQSCLTCCMCHSMIFLPSPGLWNHSDLSQCSNQANQTFEIGSGHLQALSLGWKNTSSFSKFCPSKKNAQRNASKASGQFPTDFVFFHMGFRDTSFQSEDPIVLKQCYMGWPICDLKLSQHSRRVAWEVWSVLLTLRPRTSREAQE